ncbi:choice-of-anchor Q domain-containing protein [Tuwongella immobilis]|uniref:Uncharacterized protein n=1 Tax=Tuwongella immobilis TaxID=692036 RepID=A0A6C2YP04_9BACT|nr:choice-of-anchor Q domain-containing protein [Tuwongella immobilis]VIP03350.1 Uncharacterized protein OS=Pedosphaera parvula (strain Ellin514) GN=Cflav_PD5148 PE=4 SV=1 [Tuwongella immobilis]VTS04072.1 Uncharacterized protein OS=Pedosphaera parvula (strain Ellin514) GN=Cflav_PD5148 PE=4 SV=1 [Tuwongella immobilis]
MNRSRLHVERLEDRAVPAILTVTSLADSGNGTLREQISIANSTNEHDVIRFSETLARGVIDLVSIADRTWGPTALWITSSITVEGTGQILRRAGGAGAMRLFGIAPGASLRLEHLSLENGLALGGNGGSGEAGGGGGAGLGGAIYNAGSLTLVATTFANNHAIGGDGGDGGNLGAGYGVGGSLQGNGGVLPPPVNPPVLPPPNNPPIVQPSPPPPLSPPVEGGGLDSSKTTQLKHGNIHDATLAILTGAVATIPTPPPATLPPIPSTPPLPAVNTLIPSVYGQGGTANALDALGGFGSGAAGRAGINLTGGLGGGQGLGTAGGGGAGMGGAIFNQGGTLTIINSTFVDNLAMAGEGGFNGVQSALSGSAFGGAIFNLSGVVTVVHSTLTRNRVILPTSVPATAPSTARGAGIFSTAVSMEGISGVAGRVELINSIVFGNAGGPDVSNPDQAGFGSSVIAVLPNRVGSLQGGNIDSRGVSNDDPGLGSFQDHGGWTKTVSLRPGSSAQNLGAEVPRQLGPALDQRGLPRDDKPDLGAYEVANPLAIPPVPLSQQSSEDDTVMLIVSAYRSILRRNPTATETGQASQLLQAADLEALAESLWQSREHREFQVRQMSLAVLGRTPTATESQSWVGKLLQGVGELVLLQELFAHSEFGGSLNSTSFLDKLGWQLWNRELTFTERDSALQRLNSGVSRETIIQEWLWNVEFLTPTLQGYHVAFVGNRMSAESAMLMAERIRVGEERLDRFVIQMIVDQSLKQIQVPLTP